MKKKYMLLALILFLAIGFAVVSTSLFINGSTSFGAKEDDFDVYFSEAILDGTDVSAHVISSDRKTITYTTKTLAIVGDKSILDYTVVNNSSHYDAEVSVNCELEDNEYITVDNSLYEVIIPAKTEKDGVLTVTLNRTSLEEYTLGLVCTIEAKAIERDTIATDAISPMGDVSYSIYGEIKDGTDPITGESVAIPADSKYITTDSTGYFYIEVDEKESYTLYLVGDETVEEIKTLSEEEIKAISTSNVEITPNSSAVNFENGYIISNFNIHEIVNLTVTIDKDNREEVESKSYKKGYKYGDLGEPTKEGYKFLGWFKEDGTEVTVNTIISEDKDHKVIAKWEARTYTLTLNTNGGTVTPTTVEVTYDGTYGELPTPTKAGYEFLGWKDENGNVIESTTKVSIASNHELIAEWENAIIEVSFNANGGTVSGDTKTVTHGSTYGELPEASREGYTFDGWYTEETGGTKIESTSTVDAIEAQTLYARWIANTYTVSYDANGGTGTMSSITHTYDEEKNLTANTFTRTGYTFTGWNTEANGSGTSYANSAAVSNLTATNEGNVTLYAQWTANTYTVTFNANGGTVSPTTKEVTFDSEYEELPTPSRTGYVFINWKDASGNVIESTTEVSIASNHELTAEWENDVVEVTFDANGGTGSATAKIVSYDKEYGELPTATRDGYTFEGWYTAETEGTKIESTTIVNNVANHTLYARWSTAIAIYSATDNSLNFYHIDTSIPIGDTYNEKEVTELYTEFITETYYKETDDSNLAPWYDIKDDITSITVVDEISPTNMDYWFYDIYNVANIDVTALDTSEVDSMRSTFRETGKYATSLKITGLSSWDTSSVLDMNYMFSESGYEVATYDIGDLDNWDTSQVTDMSGMFNKAGYQTETFDIGDIGKWNTSKVETMYYMFNDAGYTATTWAIGDLTNWDTSQVTDMSRMFDSAGYNATTWDIGELTNWDTSKVTTTNRMFNSTARNAEIFDIGDIGNWDTSRVADMGNMFKSTGKNAKTWSIGDLDNWDTSQVINMSYMFNDTAFYTSDEFDIGNLSAWDTSLVEDMSYMFNDAGYSAATWNIGDLSAWDTSRVTNLAYTFDGAGKNANSFDIGNLDNWNTSLVEDMSYTFDGAGENATSFNIGNLTNWDTSKVTNMTNMFSSAGQKASTFDIGDLGKWDTLQVTDMSNMFEAAGATATTFNIGDLSEWNTSKVTNMTYMFEIAGSSAETFDIGNLDNWDVSLVTDMMHMFSDAGAAATTFNIGDLSAWEVANVTTMANMFDSAGYSAETFDIGNLNNWNVANVTTMANMFDSAGANATTFNIGDLTSWNVANVTDMSNMFYDAGRMATTWSIGTLSTWNVANVTTMASMFYDAGETAATFELDLSAWDVTNVTDMNNMFNDTGYNATTWSIGDLSNWKVTNVKDMSFMFDGAGAYATTFDIGNLSNWNTSNVTTMANMFASAGVYSTTFDIGNISTWNVANVTDMSNMFKEAGYKADYSLDLSGWTVTNVTAYDSFNTNVEDKVIAPTFV